MKRLLTLVTTMLFTVILISQVPEKMSYQAVVRNTGGALVKNTPVGIKISILPETKGIIYSETHTVTTNNDGLVTLQIGGGTVVFGTFSAINWSTGGPYLLQTEIDPSGGTSYTITGTTKILTVPYALYAKSADYNSLINKPLLFDGTWTSLTGKPVFTTVATSGSYIDLLNKPVLSTVATSGSYIDLLNKPVLSTVATSGSYNDLLNKPVILNSQWTTSGSNIYYNTGNVGIGTISPASKLVIQPPAGWVDDVPLFEVKNKYGYPVLAVYNNGVRILVEDTDGKGGLKSGFAIGGFDQSKAGATYDLMTVSPDSIRLFIDNTELTKGGRKGGFAIGSFDATKAGVDDKGFMHMSPDASTSRGHYNTFAGYESGKTNSGMFNVFLGHQAGSNSTKTNYNTIIGFQAGQYTSTNLDPANDGSANVFIGQQAGQNVTTGSRSVLIGMFSGLFWTGGGLKDRHNVFIGFNAGSGLASGTIGSVVGNYNTYIGTEAGARMLKGDLNVFIGDRAGVEARQGQHNVLIGGLVNYYRYVPVSRTDSINDNVYIGFGAGGQNFNGDRNTMIGSASGAESKGSGNVFIGNKTGMNETGSNKLYIDNSDTPSPLIYGDFTDGSERVTFNGEVRISYPSASYDVWIQGGSATAGSDRNLALLGVENGVGDQLYLNYGGEYTGGTIIGGNVGIGTITPSHKLEVIGNTAITGNLNVSGQVHGGGYSASSTSLSGFNMELGGLAPTNINGQATIYLHHHSNIAHQLRYASGVLYLEAAGNGLGTSSTPYLQVNGGILAAINGGNVGIGTNNPSFRFQVNNSLADYVAYINNTMGVNTARGLKITSGSNSVSGSIFIGFHRPDNVSIGLITQNSATTVNYGTTSDARVKENITDTRFSIDDLLKVKVHDFNFIYDPDKQSCTGFIAQELVDIFPNAVTKPESDKDLWTLDYGKITPLLVKAIQDQQMQIESQDEKIDRLEKMVEELQTMVAGNR